MKTATNKSTVAGSYRDPTGFLYTDQGVLYRQINPSGFDDYFTLMVSGLYQDLTTAEMLISHEEVSEYDPEYPPPEIVIKPERVAFISYPYEWSFSQLKHAAQLTLQVQKIALHKGMSLKDSSAYNIQFHRGKPILIDTLSFERYREGEPWVAYRQFCQHFLAPLALMAYTDVRLSQLLRIYIDGIPLDLASKLLPRKTSLNMSINMHIHLHAKSQERYADAEVDLNKNRRQMKVHQLLGLIDNLASAINKLSWNAGQTDWAEYDHFHNYSPVAHQHKQDLVAEFLSQTQSTTVWDLGANIGKFSRIASQQKIETIAYDIDPGAVETNYLRAVEEGDEYLIPLISDLTNPSPGLGWALEERQSLLDRGPVDTVFALALIHHLVIGNNVPLSHLASFFSRICQWLIIEFIPKSDPQIKKLLQVRKDIFTEYNQDRFVAELGTYFTFLGQQKIKETERVLFLFQNKSIPSS
jgi:2-polyprenyl-3-methyl-5-hydroxy-6-metoxy-1,4-benzoquinol methylase